MSFKFTRDGQVLTFVFPNAADLQAAMRRVGAFYEDKSRKGVFVPLDAPEVTSLCAYYKGYNFPLTNVHAWLDALHAHHVPQDGTALSEEGTAGWQTYCCPQEAAWLSHLLQVTAEDARERLYIIACAKQQEKAVLFHEKLHALYYLSPPYRASVHAIYCEIPPAIQKVIEYDFTMRKYDSAVFEDEFQAYCSENVREFGKKCVAVCTDAARQLKEAQAKAWAALSQ